MNVIVAMTAAHIDQIAEIEKDSFLTPWSRSMLANELKNELASYFIVENQGEVVAYMGYYRILDEGHITNIAVKREWRGRGIGKELLSYTLNNMRERGVSRTTLEVNEHNNIAINLYVSFGFKLLGRRPRYYEGRDDALIYWLDFSEEQN